MSIDAAFPASAVAMHLTILSFKLGECNIALAGGTNLLACSDMFTVDGYRRADDVATVDFKRRLDAIRDKYHIHGLIRSVETSHAGTAISFTRLEDETRTTLFEKILAEARMAADDIDYIELHGTGTQVGDLTESRSVTFRLERPRPKDRPLKIRSIKPNVDHSEAAPSATSLTKGLLMLKHQTIPRPIGIKTCLNPMLSSFSALHVVVPKDNMSYPALSDKPRRMLVNIFNS